MRCQTLKPTGRPLARRVLQTTLAVSTLLAMAAVAAAQPPCDRLLRKLIDDIPEGHPAERINGGLEKLAELEALEGIGEQAIRNVDTVMQASPRHATADAYEQLLGARSVDEAEEIFRISSDFGEEGKRGLTRSATFEAVDGVEAGQSASRVMGTNWQSAAGKEATFRDIDALIDAEVPGVDPLFKKAGEQAAGANTGGIFEIQASAAIHRDPNKWGTLEGVFVDQGGPGTLNKIDTLTDTHAFQMKSKFDPDTFIRFRDDGDVTLRDLQLLEAQSGGRARVLALSNPVHPDDAADLAAACAARNIEIEFFPLQR